MEFKLAFLADLKEDQIELDTAALILSSLDHNNISLLPYVDTLKAVGDRLDQYIAGLNIGSSSILDYASVMVDVIGREFKFRGDCSIYGVRNCADMVKVIDQRRGSPVALAIIYAAAGRRLGMAASIVRASSHALVKIDFRGEFIIIDPSRLKVRVDGGIDQFCEINQNDNWHICSDNRWCHLPNKMVLVCLLISQALFLEDLCEFRRAAKIYMRVMIIAPHYSLEFCELLRIRLRGGNITFNKYNIGDILNLFYDVNCDESIDRDGGFLRDSRHLN